MADIDMTFSYVNERPQIEEILRSEGWKPHKDSTLKSWRKEDLVDLIRCLERNWAIEIAWRQNAIKAAEIQINELKQRIDRYLSGD